MPDFLSELASKTGMESDQAHQGVGALLTMLKSRLDPEVFSHLKDAIPNSDHILSSAEKKIGSAGTGLLDAVKSMAGKLMGGAGQDPAAALESHFAGMGLSRDHLQSLLPKLHQMLASKLPPNVLEQIKQHVPQFGPPAEAVTSK